MEHTRASLAPVRQITAAPVACGLAAPAAGAEAGRVRIGEAEIAFETLGRSGPVVVFESGRGEDMRSWEQVARPLAACARVVLYDRPGIGRSSPRMGASVLLADTVVDQLAALLHAIDMPPLYILVGHSLGGFYAQAFARKRPAEVAAVVLVDAASPFEPPGVFVSTVPPKPGSIEAAEEAGFAPSVKAMLAGPPFPPVPVIVLAATNHGDTPEREALWRETQARTAALSPKGQLRIVDGSGHFIQIDRPQAVVDAVLEALRQTGRTFLLVRQPTRSVEATRDSAR
jgi:pimeloyl-ACP methyl ester carboxylesterase